MDFLIPSHRERPGDDPIFALNAEAKAKAAAGENVVNATIGALLDDDGKLAVMPTVVECLDQLAPALRAAYAPIPGLSDFRRAVIDDLLGPYGMADMATGVATPGGTGALRMAIDNFLEPHQTMLTSSFFWGPYRTLADEAGRSFATFNMFDSSGRFDVADMGRSLDAIIGSQGRALLVLNTPCHNPTGYSLDREEWEATVNVLQRHAKKAPIVVLMDIAYSYYAPEGLDIAMESLTRISGDALVLFAWSASKSFLQYGLRVGSLVALMPEPTQRKRIEAALTFSCRGLWSNCNAGGMHAITKVLSEPELVTRVRAERAQFVAMLAKRVERWNELAGAKGLHFPRYDGGFFTTVFCDDAQAAAAQLRERGVYVVPLAGALRVAMCAVNEAQIERIVDAIAEVLGER